MMVDLCVVAYNTRPLMERFINTLHSDARKPLPWNLWIADNGSTDDTSDYLMSMCVDGPNWNGVSYENIAGFKNENIGYSAACNQLASYGRAEIIGLLNADVWLTTTDVSRIVQAFEDDPDLAILGPKQRDEQGRITHAGIFGGLEQPKHRGWMQWDPNDELYRDKVEATLISGSAYFIRRSVWEELASCPIYRAFLSSQVGIEISPGGFLPTRHYFEETFCTAHAHHHGHKVMYDGTISIGHTWHASSPVGSHADAQFSASRDLFIRACDWHGIPHNYRAVLPQ